MFRRLRGTPFVFTDILNALRLGEGVWLRGAPGSGRSYQLNHIADSWVGSVLWLQSDQLRGSLDWVKRLPDDVLICVDDAPEQARAVLSKRPVIAAGHRPGPGWTIVDIEPIPEDEGVQLFLRHAPLAQPMTLVQRLVHRLGGNPTAIIAAAKRWPTERIETILANPFPSWPSLREMVNALTDAGQDALALMSHLPGPVRYGGLARCGVMNGVQELVAIGWVTVDAPGLFRLAAPLAEMVRPWKPVDITPYCQWFLDESRERALSWDVSGGCPDGFRSGLWLTLWSQRESPLPPPWFFLAWSLSAEEPRELLNALRDAEDALPPIVMARCAARAHQTLGTLHQAAAVLHEALQHDNDPHHHAFALMELGRIEHRLGDITAARTHTLSALHQLSALGMDRGRLLCQTNIAALDHSASNLANAQQGYLDVIAEANATGAIRLRGQARCRLGILLLEENELDEAQRLLEQAIQDLPVGCDNRLLAIALINQAAVEMLQGHILAADRSCRDAVRLLSARDGVLVALCHARRGALAALRGDRAAARRHHQYAISAQAQNANTQAIVSLWDIVVEWNTGDQTRALKRRRQCLDHTLPLLEVGDEARLVLRVLEGLAMQPGETLLVGPAGAWFRVPGAEPVGVQRFESATRILTHLARTAEANPEVFCDSDTLIGAGWPGEQIIPGAARNRLAVTLNQLRRLGLRGLLQRSRAGWRLDTNRPVLLMRSENVTALRLPRRAQSSGVRRDSAAQPRAMRA